jgi:hypothetical protein
MKTKLIANTLQEDLNALGIGGLNEDVMASVALGVPLSEKSCGMGKGMADDEEEMDDEEEEEDGEDYEESRHDPMDGPFVTHTLFDRIMALPFENLAEEDVQRVIEGLKTKRIPRNVRGIQERAEEVAQHLVQEVMGKRTRKFKAGGMAKKLSIVCPQGYRKNPNGKGCVRAAVAAGGAGKLAKSKRKASLWARTGKGAKSAKKSERMAGRRGEEFAVELEHLLGEQVDRTMSVRDEIMGRIGNIIEMINLEFDDEAVADVFESAVDSLAASYEAGRLDEDVMDADAFLAEIRPVMALISKSLDRLDTVGSGN